MLNNIVKRFILLGCVFGICYGGAAVVTTDNTIIEKNKPSNEMAKLSMKKIAILPFDVDANAIKIRGISDSALSLDIQQGLINQFTQSRKFRVVDRDHSDDEVYKNEVAKITVNNALESGISQIDKTTVADYIVTGSLSNISIYSKKSRYYGSEFLKWTALATASYKLLDLKTMEVKWANTVTVELPSSVVANHVTEDGNPSPELQNRLIEHLSKVMSDQIIGVAYPLTVIKVRDGDVYLNQGGGRVQKGTVYKVFEQGSVTKDETTWQLITIVGKNIATIRISDVMPKYSIGKFVSGNMSKIQVNDQAYLQSEK